MLDFNVLEFGLEKFYVFPGLLAILGISAIRAFRGFRVTRFSTNYPRSGDSITLNLVTALPSAVTGVGSAGVAAPSSWAKAMLATRAKPKSV